MSGVPHAPTALSVQPKDMTPRWLARFLSDCKDLWTLITKGQPEDDPHLASRMLAELAKFTPEQVDWDRWEGERFAAHPKAFWFDPERYDDTPYAWPRDDVLSNLRGQIAYIKRSNAWAQSSQYQNNLSAHENYHQRLAQTQYARQSNSVFDLLGRRI